MRLLFNNVEEFISELVARGPNVDGIVRRTIRRRQENPFVYTTLIVTYLRQPVDGGPIILVELSHYLGVRPAGASADEDDDVQRRMEAAWNMVTQAIEAAGHPVTHGCYELA